MIIRADVLLCSRNWEFLELSKGVPVAQNYIAALLKTVSRENTINQDTPLSVQELRQLFDRLGMMYLLLVRS